MLEGALVIIPFFAMFFATIDFGIAIYLRNQFQHAVREGVRYAVTFQLLSGMGQDASIRAVVRDQSAGFLSASNVGTYVFIRYYDPKTLVETAVNDPGNIVEVSIEGFQIGVVAPLLRNANPIPITARASDRMESLPDGQNRPAR